MAKKQVAAVVKIQIPAGQASPAPPVGTALGPHGVAIMDFCKDYNAKTEDKRGQIVPVEITIYEDRSFSFILKTPPTPFLIRQAAGLETAANNPGREVAGTISVAHPSNAMPGARFHAIPLCDQPASNAMEIRSPFRNPK